MLKIDGCIPVYPLRNETYMPKWKRRIIFQTLWLEPAGWQLTIRFCHRNPNLRLAEQLLGGTKRYLTKNIFGLELINGCFFVCSEKIDLETIIKKMEAISYCVNLRSYYGVLP